MVTRSYQLLSFFFLLGKSRGAPQQGREVQTSAGCLDFADAGFHCVPIFQCDDEGIIKTDAGGLFDPRYFNHLKRTNNHPSIPFYYITNNKDITGLQKITAKTMSTLTESVAHLKKSKRCAPPVQPPLTCVASTPTAPPSTQAAILKISPADPTAVPELRTTVKMMMRK